MRARKQVYFQEPVSYCNGSSPLVYDIHLPMAPRIVSTDSSLVSSLVSEPRLHHLCGLTSGKKQTISNALGETRGYYFPMGGSVVE